MNLRWAHITSQILVTTILIAVIAAFDFRDDLQGECPGQYCKRIGRCCDNRMDNCSVPISTTLCYCDQFCYWNPGDCCPDYRPYCLKQTLPPPDPTIGCMYKEKSMRHLATIKENCNVWKCDKGIVTCEQDLCLVDDDLIYIVNSIKGGRWSAKKYDEFWGRKYKEGLRLRLGFSSKSVTPEHFVLYQKTTGL